MNTSRLRTLMVLFSLMLGVSFVPENPVLAADPAPKSGATNAPKANPGPGKGTNSNAAPKSAVPLQQSWTGSWNNRKYNTTGALTCTVVGEQGGQWMARFTGTGLGRPFNYVALITPGRNGNVTTLQGNTKIDGDDYQWTGSVSGANMTGSFRSRSGNNGEFRLQAKR